MSESPQPFFWIRRNGDTYVPLIPLDELPPGVSIRGISATKDWLDISHGEMRFLGDHDNHDGVYYVVEVQDNNSESEDSSTTPTKMNAGIDQIQVRPLPSLTSTETFADRDQARIDNIIHGRDDSPEYSQPETAHGTPKYQGNPGTLGKKVYCTYWIRTGNCNYMQEGCKYKHEIPPDDETRLAIGVRTYPTWPREDPVTAPRPPPIKVFQVLKPEIQGSWRRQEAADAQVKSSGSQKTFLRTAPLESSVPNSGSSQTQSSASPPAKFSGSRQPMNLPSRPPPQIAAANADQHFPSYANHSVQQNARAQDGRPVIVRDSAQFRAAAATTAGSHSGQSTHIAPQPLHPQPASLFTKINPRPATMQQSTGHLSTAQPEAGKMQILSPPKYKANPFAQRTASGLQSQANGNAHNDSVSDVRSANLKARTSSSPPPYMPIQASNGMSDGNGQPLSAGRRVTASTHNGGDNADSSSSHINTPVSSSNNGIVQANDNADNNLENDSANPRAPATTTSTVGTNPPRISGFKGRFSLSGMDPAIIHESRGRTPVSIKARDSRLFDPNAPSDFKSNNAASESESHHNSHQTSRSALDSPPPVHRRLFRAPGEEEFVVNSTEDASAKPPRSIKKHASRSFGGSKDLGKKYGQSTQGQSGHRRF